MSLGPGHNELGSSEDDEARLTQRLVNTLEPVVGTNAIRASVNIDYDHGSIEESQEKYDPTVSAVLSSQKNEDEATGGGAVPIGVPGTASNVPTATKTKPAAGNTATAQQGSSQSSKSENTQYGVNKTVTHSISPGGRIQRITAALLVDDVLVKNVQKGKTTYTRQKRSQDELNKIRELAEAAIGFDAKRGDTISVQNMSFGANAADTDVPAAGFATQVQKAVTDYSPLLRPLSMVVLFILAYLFLIRPIQKQAFAPGQLTAGAGGGHGALGGAAQVQPLAVGGAPAELGTGNMRAAQLKAQTFELARQKPLDTARTMQAWLREEES
jgi:flagellar M-ring protein FliF